MPPVMGIAAFVMAELLQVPYGRIALAGAIPAIAYYFALFMIVDLRARRTGIGSLGAEELAATEPVLPRLHLFLAPVALVALLIQGYSATYAALVGTVVAFVAAFLPMGQPSHPALPARHDRRCRKTGGPGRDPHHGHRHHHRRGRSSRTWPSSSPPG